MELHEKTIIRRVSSTHVVREEDSESRTISGIAVVYRSPQKIYSSYTEEIAAGCFGKSIEAPHVCALWQHDHSKVLGRVGSSTLRLEDRSDGLYFRVVMPKTTTGDEALELVQRGDVNECSFAAIVTTTENKKISDTEYSVKIIEADLLEISLVTWPAYSGTSAIGRSYTATSEDQIMSQLEAEYELRNRTRILDARLDALRIL